MGGGGTRPSLMGGRPCGGLARAGSPFGVVSRVNPAQNPGRARCGSVFVSVESPVSWPHSQSLEMSIVFCLYRRSLNDEHLFFVGCCVSSSNV